MDKKLEILEKLIDRALDQLYQEDSYLIKNGVHERSIVFRFAHYLQNLMDESNELKEFDLDLEYNKNGIFAKRIPARIRGTFPDLIIHKRGTNKGVYCYLHPWVQKICRYGRQKPSGNTSSVH